MGLMKTTIPTINYTPLTTQSSCIDDNGIISTADYVISIHWPQLRIGTDLRVEQVDGISVTFVSTYNYENRIIVLMQRNDSYMIYLRWNNTEYQINEFKCQKITNRNGVLSMIECHCPDI